MTFAVTKIAITVNGTVFEGTVTSNATVIDIPASSRGLINAVSATCTDAAGTVTVTGWSGVSVPSAVSLTVSDGTNTATVTATVKVASGTETFTKPGWFSFKRMNMKATYATGGVVLAGVKEVLNVQCSGITGYEFDPVSKKLKLFKAVTPTEVTANTVVYMAVLAITDA